jgi:hypothetical protein
MEKLIDAGLVVLLLSIAVSLTVWLIRRAGVRKFPQEEDESSPGGWVLGLVECFFYFAVLCTDGAGYLAGAWLVFKLGTKWQSATLYKPTKNEVQRTIRPFQVGTLANLLVGLIGAAIWRA